MTNVESVLEIPLYLLHSIQDVTVWEGLPEKFVAQWNTEYTDDELKSIDHAVQSAIAHPEHNFHSIIDVHHSNDPIYEFLCKFAKSTGVV